MGNCIKTIKGYGRLMKVFVAGSRTIPELNNEVIKEIDNIIENGHTIFIGDSIGIDKAVQEYCYEKKYPYVKIYASNGIARNNIGNWEVIAVPVEPHIKGFDFYAAKDLVMAKESDYGFMIWDGKSKGTYNNLINMTQLRKKVTVYYTPEEKFYSLSKLEEVKKLLTSAKL